MFINMFNTVLYKGQIGHMYYTNVLFRRPHRSYVLYTLEYIYVCIISRRCLFLLQNLPSYFALDKDKHRQKGWTTIESYAACFTSLVDRSPVAPPTIMPPVYVGNYSVDSWLEHGPKVKSGSHDSCQPSHDSDDLLKVLTSGGPEVKSEVTRGQVVRRVCFD